MSGRRDRSRSPMRGSSSRRREGKVTDLMKSSENTVLPNVMNQMMMTNMYQHGNMLMGGMYNMVVPNTMMGNSMIPASGMDMIPTTGMDMLSQQSIDISALSTQPITTAGATMDMGLMGGVMMDSSLMGMFSNMTAESMQEKKEMDLKYSKLTPPAPGSQQPPKRTKPPGCRTIFVGGLPDKIRESTVREIFERFGRIQILRLSKKNFCHIRFDREACVDAAMTISGYQIKLKDKDKDEAGDDDDSHAMNGYLHVDYALSRDDQSDYERRQRQALRVQQQQIIEMSAQQEAIASRSSSYRRSPSPVRVQPFTNAAIVQLAEKIKSEDQFSATLPTLISWLERGECSKRNSNQFYTMIQATNSHIRRLFGEKMQAEEELQTCKERVKNHIQNIIVQLEQVAIVFTAATHQRVWDHFTKPQRKNIETWQKMSQEFNTIKEEFHEKFLNEDADFNGTNKKVNMDTSDSENEEVQQLKRENESLQFQLEAYKNEVDVIKSDAIKEMEKFKAQFIARQALQGALDKNPPLPSPVAKPPPPPLPEDVDSQVKLNEVVEANCGEGKLIGVMAAFLQVHPQGASLDYVVSYVRALFPAVSQATIHHVLQKHEDVFQRTTSGVGANIENRWSFVAFENRA